VWELIWLMVIMKIPILYLCWIVYWAIKSEPRPEEPIRLAAADDGLEPSPWRTNRQPRNPRPHGRPTRSYARTRRARVRA
jgi:hypothetical protein